MQDEGYKCYTPSIYTTSVGVINNVPQDLSTEEIQEYIICDFNILNVERMNLFDKESNSNKPGNKIK